MTATVCTCDARSAPCVLCGSARRGRPCATCVESDGHWSPQKHIRRLAPGAVCHRCINRIGGSVSCGWGSAYRVGGPDGLARLEILHVDQDDLAAAVYLYELGYVPAARPRTWFRVGDIPWLKPGAQARWAAAAAAARAWNEEHGR